MFQCVSRTSQLAAGRKSADLIFRGSSSYKGSSSQLAACDLEASTEFQLVQLLYSQLAARSFSSL